jgi:repressor LexA
VTNDRLDRVVPFIELFIAEKGFAPSTRELAAGLGFKSTESIHRYLIRLRDTGAIEWEPGKARTLRVVAHGDDGSDHI